MGVLVGTDQILYGNTVAADLFGNIAQNTEAGNDVHRGCVNCTGH